MEGFGEALSLFASGKSAESGSVAATALASINTAITNSGLDLGNVQGLITKKLASSAVGLFGGNVSVNDLLNREQGIIFNPNMELLFNGPTLRSFKFSFKMTPRNQNESEAVANLSLIHI